MTTDFRGQRESIEEKQPLKSLTQKQKNMNKLLSDRMKMEEEVLDTLALLIEGMGVIGDAYRDFEQSLEAFLLQNKIVRDEIELGRVHYAKDYGEFKKFIETNLQCYKSQYQEIRTKKLSMDKALQTFNALQKKYAKDKKHLYSMVIDGKGPTMSEKGAKAVLEYETKIDNFAINMGQKLQIADKQYKDLHKTYKETTSSVIEVGNIIMETQRNSQSKF